MTVRCWVFLLGVAVAGCGPKTLAAKMKDADRLSDKIGGLLDTAEKALGEAEPTKAEEALDEAKKLLAEPDMQYSPERELYLGRHAELAPRLAEARAARRQKDIEEAVVNERAQIGPALQAMKDAAENIGGPKVSEESVEAAQSAISGLEKAVGASDDRRVLALKDASFVGYLKRAKAEAEKAQGVLSKAEKKLKFLKGPVAHKQKAAEEMKEAKSEKDAAAKRTLIASSAAGYAKCVSAGTPFNKGEFATEKILIGTATTSVESFLETCKAAQESTEQALAKLPKAKPPGKKKR